MATHASDMTLSYASTAAAAADSLSGKVRIFNTGVVQLTNVQLQASSTGNTASVQHSCPAGAISVGGTKICDVTVTPKQSSLDDGLVIEVNAVATADTDVDSNNVQAEAAAVTIGPVQSPDFTYSLSAGAAPTTPTAGDKVSLDLSISNEGNVKFKTVTPSFTVNGNAVSFAGTSCVISSSMPGLTAKGTSTTASVGTCTVQYTITQADIESVALSIDGQVSATYT
jgi:uncharacterized membrane protein